MNAEPCPICGMLAEPPGKMDRGRHNIEHWRCPSCGGFAINPHERIQVPTRLKADEKAMLAAYLAEQRMHGRKNGPLLVCFEPCDLDGFRTLKIGLALEEMRRVFSDPDERLNRALLNIAAKTRRWGEAVKITHFPALYAMDWPEARFIANVLAKLKYVRIASERQGEFISPVIMVHGWAYLKEIEYARQDKPGSKAFVAMRIGSETERAYQEGIRPAVQSAGYEPIRMDDQPFPNNICDRILAEIRSSRFLVVDCTGQRHHAYFEAGFATGLGIPVFWTCRKDFFDPQKTWTLTCEEDGAQYAFGFPPFDIRQYNTIVWEEPEDIRRELQYRIEALLGQGQIRGGAQLAINTVGRDKNGNT